MTVIDNVKELTWLHKEGTLSDNEYYEALARLENKPSTKTQSLPDFQGKYKDAPLECEHCQEATDRLDQTSRKDWLCEVCFVKDVSYHIENTPILS